MEELNEDEMWPAKVENLSLDIFRAAKYQLQTTGIRFYRGSMVKRDRWSSDEEIADSIRNLEDKIKVLKEYLGE